MNILFISYYNPLGQGGFEKQTRGLFQTLVERGHKIACLCGSTKEETEKLQSQIEATKLFELGVYVLEYEDKYYNFWASILFWLVKHPSKFLGQQFSTFQSYLQKKIEYLFQELSIDVIHSLALKTTYFFSNKQQYPLVIDLVDCMSQHKKRTISYLYQERKFKQLTWGIIDLKKTLKLEKDLLLSHRQSPIAVVAKSDRAMLQKIYPHNSIHVVSHPVTINDNYCGTNTQNTSQVLVFYGFMNTVWNIDAFNFLVHHIMPYVIKVKSSVKLKLTGLHLSQETLALSDKYSWLEIIPYVENIQDFVNEATLACWPFRYGSGVKNKILESMCLGKAVVTTNIGAEAFTKAQKRGMLIANEPQDLANHIINLLDNQDECIRLGAINRRIIKKYFTWNQKAQDYLKLYKIARKNILNLRN